jgi:hypothetical protein
MYPTLTRKIGCATTNIEDKFDAKTLERIDAELVRLNPGGRFDSVYTFSVKAELRHSDVHHMSVGGEYFVELGKRKYWWMYADEMEKDLTNEERRKMLGKRKTETWKPNVRLTSWLWRENVLYHRIEDSQSFRAALSFASTSLSAQKCPAPATSTLVNRDPGAALSWLDHSRILFADVKMSWSP